MPDKLDIIRALLAQAPLIEGVLQTHLIGPGVIDHNCSNPTCAIDSQTNNLVAFRQINPGEIATLNYLTTEYELISPFECKCGERDCFGVIKGFKFLSPLEKERLRQRFPLVTYLQAFLYENLP